MCFVVAQSRLLNEKLFLAVAEFFFAEFGILCLNAAHTQDEQESQGIKSSFIMVGLFINFRICISEILV